MSSELSATLQEALGADYRIDCPLAGGGMSRLFKATDLRHNRSVVVKVLTPDLETELSVARFQREIELTVRLQHPHILPIITSGAWSAGRYYVTPYMAGESLRARIAREGKLPLDDIVRIIKDVSGALAFAHSRGIVHRDVKPGNILLSDGHAILADFGIARATNTTATPLTASGMRLGTPAYMPPRTFSDERADLYALGVVAFEMLSGVLPSVGDLTVRRVVALRGSLPGDSHATIAQLVRGIVAALSAPEGKTAGRAMPIQHVFTSSRSRWKWSAIWLALIGALGIGGVAASALVARIRFSAAPSSSLDTTRVVVFPFEGEGAATVQPTELLVEALSRWRGISVVDPFQVADAVARSNASKEARGSGREIARSLGAGRYIRGRISSASDSLRLPPRCTTSGVT